MWGYQIVSLNYIGLGINTIIKTDCGHILLGEIELNYDIAISTPIFLFKEVFMLKILADLYSASKNL